jgi:carbonic anhydrase
MVRALVLIITGAVMCGVCSPIMNVESVFTWRYSGVLSESAGWWNQSFPFCDVQKNPMQSPINIVTSSISSTQVSIEVYGTSSVPPYRAAAVYTNALNFLRGDIWPQSIVVNMSATSSLVKLNGSLFLLHHISQRFPSEHSIDGVFYDAEVHYVFFPFNASNPKAYYPGGLTIAVPVSRSTVDDDERFSAVFAAGKHAVGRGSTTIPFVFPNLNNVAVYEGSMSFPPCLPNMTWVVSLSPMQVNQVSFDLAANAAPTPASGRSVQPAEGRVVSAATLNFSHSVFVTFPSAAALNNRSVFLSVADESPDVSSDVLEYAVYMSGFIALFLLICLVVLLYERFTFFSPVRETWKNKETNQEVFGCRQPGEEEEDRLAEGDGGDADEEEEREEEEEADEEQ